MNEFADAIMQTLPELLVRDLAEQQDDFLAKGTSSSVRTPADHPSVRDLAYFETLSQSPPPSLPRRNPSRVLHRFHQQVGPETFLCSLKQSSVERAWRSEREAILKNAAVCHSRYSTHSWASRREHQRRHRHHIPSPRNKQHNSIRVHMKQETDQDTRRVFLNGMDEEWGSDSSADAETGLSSPSVRTRKQSITTAATSIDFQLSSGEKDMEGCSTEPYPDESDYTADGGHSKGDHLAYGFRSDDYSTRRSPEVIAVDNSEKQTAWQAWNDGGSWFDLGEHEAQIGDKRIGTDPRRYGRRIDSPQDAHKDASYDGLALDDQYNAHNGDSLPPQSGELSYRQDESSHSPADVLLRTQHGQLSQGQQSDLPGVVLSQVQSGLSSQGRGGGLSSSSGAGPSHTQKGVSSYCPWDHSSYAPGPPLSHVQIPFPSQSRDGNSSHQAGDESALFLSSRSHRLGPLQLHPVCSAQSPQPSTMHNDSENHNEYHDDNKDSDISYSSEHDPKLGLLLPSVPKRQSSLSHQVTPLAMGETALSLKRAPHTFPQQSSLPSPPTSLHRLPFQQHSPKDWGEAEAAVGPIVPTGRHQADHHNQLDLSAVSPDELSLPPLSVTESRHHDRSHHERTFSMRSQHQHPNLLTKPRKSHSITKMPLRNVHHWLESSSRPRQHSPSLSTASPASISPSSMRVPVPVLESLISSVQNFPETMLQLSSLPIEAIRDYSYKVKRSDTARQLIHTLESTETLTALSLSPSSPTSPTLGRKTSFTNFKSNLRGKLSRLTNSSTSPSIAEQNEPDWPPVDDSPSTAVHCDSALLRPRDARDAACISALRGVLRNASAYVLDGLYAHIIAYNYIDSFCCSTPEPVQHTEGPHLRIRPSKNVVFPPGVTSLADLQLQEDVSDNIVQEFQDDIASTTSKAVVPSKAASLLGLGSTEMGQAQKPGQGGGDSNKIHKSSSAGGGACRSGHYLESDSVLRGLRDDLAHNIKCLVDTAESDACMEATSDPEAQDSNIVRHSHRKQLDPLLMRAFSEIVRCYEELSC